MKLDSKKIISYLSIFTATIISISASIALFFYGYISLFSRFILDDFCMGQTLVEKGFWSAQSWWYLNFIGRYSFTFFIHILVGLGPRGARYAPSIFLVVLIISLFFIIFSNFYKKVNTFKLSLGSILGATTISFSILYLAPEVSESFDWVVGMTTYFLPIVFFCLALMIFSFFINFKYKQLTSRLLIALFSILIVISSGFSESFTVVACVFWAILSMVLYLYRSKIPKKNLKLSILALVVGLISMLIVIVAPGNNIRKSYFPKPQSPSIVAVQSLNETVSFITTSILNTKTSFILVFISAITLALLVGKKLRAEKASLLFIWISIIVSVLIFCSYFPPIYSLSNLPPERVLIIPMFILIIYVYISGYIFGRWLLVLSSKFLAAICILILTISVVAVFKVPLAAKTQLEDNIIKKSAFAQGFDKLDNNIRQKVASGKSEYIADPIPFTNNHEATQISDPTHWINKCVAGYYGLKSFQYHIK